MLECIWADIIGMIDREKDFASDEDVEKYAL